ncbi:hypothetical protein Mapa_008327 [Marchantia paleacea]|nr:hypothetical protein Mapa_008327 [Marchantia paleacea]
MSDLLKGLSKDLHVMALPPPVPGFQALSKTLISYCLRVGPKRSKVAKSKSSFYSGTARLSMLTLSFFLNWKL